MRIIYLVPFLSMLLWVSCLNDYNPFENMDNVDVKVRSSASSIGTRDSFPIFSTESLTVYPTVFEEIDSFTVTSQGNRLSPNSTATTVKPGAGDYCHRFSWNDTGRTSVTITVYRSDGKVFSRSYAAQIVSPLMQDSITCEVGSACTLFTPTLHDQGLEYHWYFGEFYGKTVERTHFRGGPLAVEMTIGQSRGSGLLWVDDSSGHRSPPVAFMYNFTDNQGPSITAVSGRIGTSGDSIITGDSLFLSRFMVLDKGGVRNVTVNGGDYDDRELTANGELFTKILTDMQKSGPMQPRTLSLVATDNAGTSTAKTFYVSYSPDGPKNDAVILKIVNPGTASSTTTGATASVVYNLNNYSPDTVFVRAFLGNHLSSTPDTVLPRSNKKMITWECPLTAGANLISVVAYHTDTLASEAVVIERTAIDTLPPKIPYVLINGEEGERHVTLSAEVICSFLAIGGSGTVSEVTVNGNHSSTVSGYAYRYIDTIRVTHAGTPVTIVALDNKGLRTDTTVFVRLNSPPSLAGSIARRYLIGARQSDTLGVTDPDADSVEYTVTFDTAVTPEFTTRKLDRSRFIVEWSGNGTPPEGLYTATFTLWDGYQTANVQKQFYVTQPGTTDIRPFTLAVSVPQKVDTLKDGIIDLRNNTAPVRIDCAVQDKIKILSPGDSVVVKNADAVYFSDDPGKFSIVLSNGRGSYLDTVHVLVVGANGTSDTVGRIPVLYQPRSPDYNPGLLYWMALDRGVGADLTLRDSVSLEWWINRVSSVKQFYSYSSGNEPQVDNDHSTPTGQPSLRFGPENVVLIDYEDENLEQGGAWPAAPFTALFVARIQGPLPAGGAALWSSSDYDSAYFALGISGQGKISVLTHSTGDSQTVVESCNQPGTSWQVIAFRSNGKTASSDLLHIQAGLSEVPTQTITVAPQGVSGNLMIGSTNKHYGKLTWPGNIAEILFYRRALTDAECREASAYLRYKHGI